MKLEPYLDALGIPSPSEESLKNFSNLIVDTIDAVNKRLKVTHHRVPDEPFNVIYLSYFLVEPNEWKAKFTNLKTLAFRFFRTPAIFWATIARGLYSPKVGEAYKKINPSFDPEKYLTNITHPPAPQKVTPQPTSTPTIGATLKKVISKIPERQFPAVTEYILFHAPSKSYELVYSTTLGCTKNKLSSKGKKVYPYGQPYIAKLTRLSLRTVVYAWSWLRKRGIFNKARNENPKEHHCALWYVCTSMKQIPYFRDPKNLHRKSKRQD